MQGQVVLVIGLGRIEALERLGLRDDRRREGARLVELRDIALRDTLACVSFSGNTRRAVLRAAIRPLPVQLRRILNHGEDTPAATGRR